MTFGHSVDCRNIVEVLLNGYVKSGLDNNLIVKTDSPFKLLLVIKIG